MVETSSQPNPRVTASLVTSGNSDSSGGASAIFAPQSFLGNMFLGEGFKPVYKNRSIAPGTTPSTSAGSLFTIDSILAPRPKPSSPQRPLLHHPTLHLGHIAAAASAGFGPASADFLGKCFHHFPTLYYWLINIQNKECNFLTI